MTWGSIQITCLPPLLHVSTLLRGSERKSWNILCDFFSLTRKIPLELMGWNVILPFALQFFINIQWDSHDRLYKHFKGCDTRNTKRKLTNRKGLWRRRRRIILNLIRTSTEVRICLINICREISWQLLWDLLTHSLFALNRGNCLHRKMRALVEEREREA